MNYLILLASGSGKRMHNTTPKQFIEVQDKPLIFYSLNTFEHNENIDEVVIVTKRKYFKKIYQIIEDYSFEKVHLLVEGGKFRQVSTYNALEALKGFALKNDIIIVHDAARPLVSNDDINNLIKAMDKHTSASLGTKVVDTTIKIKNKKFQELLSRDNLINIQTPQAFRYNQILKAHKKALKDNITNATDDAQLMSLINKKYYIVEGSKQNFKITTENDLLLLEALLRRKQL
ncbi:MAG: 2-C-methyl-D-erythritol 4-phosphate cytidylyltransferase [Erysipelotrichales bacterium]|nr:2-C-methyl-D-erythritol 4-phosphate cytidylyltransferase [Erysipelotrichales bacterium]